MDAGTLGLVTSFFLLVGVCGNLLMMVLKMRTDKQTAEHAELRAEPDRQRDAAEAAAKQKEALDAMAAQAAAVNQALSGLQSLSLRAIGSADASYRVANGTNEKIAVVQGHLEALRQAGNGQMADVQATGADTNERVRDLQAQPQSLGDQLAAARDRVAQLEQALTEKAS